MNSQPAKLFLKPGEMFFAKEPTIVTTLLGSCVSVTMFHPKRRIGAICHGLLPECRDNETCRCRKECEKGFRNMQCSIRIMLERFKELGISPGELEVMVFGGSDMFDNAGNKRDKQTVGAQNTQIALKLLAEAGMLVKATDIGGERGRKIYFKSDTGELLLKRLRKSSPEHHCPARP